MAKAAVSFDTVVARAFRVALGIEPRFKRPRRERTGARDRRFDGMSWCMRNERSPMDALR